MFIKIKKNMPMTMIRFPKDGVLYTEDKKKKVEFSRQYTRVRVTFYTLRSWVGIQRDYKKDVDGSRILKLTDFIEFIKNEKYK